MIIYNITMRVKKVTIIGYTKQKEFDIQGRLYPMISKEYIQSSYKCQNMYSDYLPRILLTNLQIMNLSNPLLYI